MKFVPVASVTLLLLLPVAPAGPGPNGKPSITVVIDDSAARYVLEDPERADAEREAIWERFEGYRIARVWHEKSSVPLDWRIWNREMKRIRNGDASFVATTLDLMDGLKTIEARQHEKIVWHLAAYSRTDVALTAYVYLVAFTHSYAFCVENNRIGIDVAGDEWHSDPECLLNTLIHEVYHTVFRQISPDVAALEVDPVDGGTFARFSYAFLQSEGMATWVAYRSLDLFPSRYEHPDYALLESEDSVRKAIGQVNGLIRQARSGPIASANQAAWDVGVEQRAYYVAGASMCRRIEERYGREPLARLVRTGSRQLVTEYNAIVPANLRIELVPAGG